MTEAAKIRMADRAFDAHFDQKKRYYSESNQFRRRGNAYSTQEPCNFAKMLAREIAIREAIDANDKKFEKMKLRNR